MPDEITLTPDQETAVSMILEEPLCLFTGLPGSGKSASLNQAVQRMRAQRQTVLLAAPTGKAARRLSEATGEVATTVHRMLEYHPDEGFRYNDADKLAADQVVIDEASMLDNELAAAVFSAINPYRTRVCFTGDDNQLPSVGCGRVLGDLIESGLVPRVNLTQVHRAAAESWVCRAAPLIRDGVCPDLTETKDFAFWQASSLEDCEEAVLEAVLGINQAHNLIPTVITPRRQKVPASAETLNLKLQQVLNPYGEPTPYRTGDGAVIRLGDTLIQRSNDYLLGVFNGEIGTALEVSRGNGKEDNERLQVMFEAHEERSALSRLQGFKTRLGYALTAHGTQGSGFPWVIVICHSGHNKMLTRQILYTMVTRASKGVILIGDRYGVQKALNTNSPPSRKTGLVERLKAGLDG